MQAVEKITFDQILRIYSFNIQMSEMKTFDRADEHSPKKRWLDRENNSTQCKFEIPRFEIPNEFIREVTKSTEGTKEKVRDNGSSR